MIVQRTYTRKELNELFKTDRIDVIKNKLTRQGYIYTTEERGQELKLTITELPPRFKMFCIEKLAFEPQTDFEMLKKFFCKVFFDEEFIQLPYSEMERRLQESIGITRQTLSKWLNHLDKQGIIHRCNMEYNYYMIRKKDGVNKAETVPREEYAKAWKPYWENKDVYGADTAFRIVKCMADGVPYKNGIVQYNAFELDVINELIDILLEESEDTMDEIVKNYKKSLKQRQNNSYSTIDKLVEDKSPATAWIEHKEELQEMRNKSEWVLITEKDREIIVDKATKEIIKVINKSLK